MLFSFTGSSSSAPAADRPLFTPSRQHSLSYLLSPMDSPQLLSKGIIIKNTIKTMNIYFHICQYVSPPHSFDLDFSTIPLTPPHSSDESEDPAPRQSLPLLPPPAAAPLSITTSDDYDDDVDDVDDDSLDLVDSPTSSPAPSSPRLSMVAAHDHEGTVQCPTCGKEYKHKSCLSKHLWEHHPGWAVTKRLKLTKHQQAQMLEAADTLYSMLKTPA